MPKLLLAGLCLLLISFGCKKKQRSEKDLLTRKWLYSSITDSNNQEVKKVVLGTDFLILNNNHSFHYQLQAAQLDKKGTWELENQDLVLIYDPGNETVPVDSTVYSMENGKARMQFFKEGARISSLDEKGVQVTRTIRRFHLDSLTEETLIFSENGIRFSYYYAAPQLNASFDFAHIFRGLIGLLALLAIAFAFSRNRSAIDWKLVGTGLLLQVIFALGVLKVSFVKRAFESLAGFFVIILDFTKSGSEFLFAGLVNDTNTFGYIFAFQVLPTVIFFSALTSLLYYFGVLQKVVYGIAWVMSKTMRLSGSESLSTAANIFLGQTEAPLMVKPFIAGMNRSEVLCVMIGGMATIAGGVLAAYVGFLGGEDPEQQQLFATHLLTASIMSAPATIVISKILLPQSEPIQEKLEMSEEKTGSNFLEAISIGTGDGIKLAVNVGAMLLVFTALIALLNYLFLHGIGEWTGLNDVIRESTQNRYEGLTLQYLLGQVFAPIAWLIGVDSADMVSVGQLLGEKTILNEFYAYTTLGKMKTESLLSDPRSILIATYALCGFANFASIGIQIGGIGTLAPNQRTTLSQLGLLALLGGTLACLMTGAIVGMLY